MSLYSLLLRNYKLILISALLGVCVAALEGLGIAVFLPILQTSQNLPSFDLPYPFNKIMSFFLQFSLSQRIQMVAILLAVITIVRVGLLYLNVQISLKIRSLVLKFCKMQGIKQLLSVGMGYLNRQKASDFYVLYENHIELGVGTIVELLCNIIPAIVTTLFLSVCLLAFSWKITLISIALVAVVSFLFNFIANKAKHLGENYVQVKTSINKALMDVVQGMKVLRLFNAQEKIEKNFEVEVDNLNNSFNRLGSLTQLIGPLYEVTGIVIMAVILILWTSFLSSDINQGSTTVLLAFFIVLSRLIPRLKQLNHARGAICSRLPAVEKLKEFLNSQDKEYIANGHETFDHFKNQIEMKNVVFRYSAEKPKVFDGLTLTIFKGSKVGIVGSSGAGKSTIAELLLRFYEPQQGEILIDGRNLKDYEMVSFRKKIGVVSQDTFLFHDTIKANIAFANFKASEEEIKKAAQRAHAHDFIMRLPEAYDTVIGDRGVMLSGGERQRLAIARAILCEPDILIFDEATSALDTTSERIVQDTLDEIARGKTVITIAHRFSTITNSDKIIVLDNGRVVEEGCQDELLMKNGLYKQYMENQVHSI